MKDENMILLLLALAGGGAAVLYYLNKDQPTEDDKKKLIESAKNKVFSNLENLRRIAEAQQKKPETPQVENVETSKPQEQKTEINNPFQTPMPDKNTEPPKTPVSEKPMMKLIPVVSKRNLKYRM